MIKGFINADNQPIASSMIIEPSNRTAAMMCFEIGLLPGVDENENVIIVRGGNQEIVNEIDIDIKIDDPNARILFPVEIESLIRQQSQENDGFVSTNIDDIPDEPQSQNAGEKRPGGGVL